MNLLELLIKELPEKGGWPEFAVAAFNMGDARSVRFKTGMGFYDVVMNTDCTSVGTVTRNEYEQAEKEKKSSSSFEHAAKQLMAWINDNANPHAVIIIDATSAVLYSGEKSITTEEFIKE